MSKVELPRISKLPEDNDYNGIWRIELSPVQWKKFIQLFEDAYPPGIELLAPPTQFEESLAAWYYCREQTMVEVGPGKWNNVGTSNVVILKSDEQMTYFIMMKEQFLKK